MWSRVRQTGTEIAPLFTQEDATSHAHPIRELEGTAHCATARWPGNAGIMAIFCPLCSALKHTSAAQNSICTCCAFRVSFQPYRTYLLSCFGFCLRNEAEAKETSRKNKRKYLMQMLQAKYITGRIRHVEQTQSR